MEKLEKLTSTLNDAAQRLQTLWFTFLFVTLYFIIATATTTHRMLFLEEGLALPLIEMKLPLLGFYVIGPTFYIVFHLYLLMMLVLLARTAGAFEVALAGAMPNKSAAQERCRMRLDNALFLQIIAGARRERRGNNGAVLRAIALISVALAPVLVLLMFQLMFLPYHSEWITWLHRLLILIDIIMIWTLWRSYRHHQGRRLLPDFELSLAWIATALVSVLTLIFSWCLATFPDEHTHDNAVAQLVDSRTHWIPIVIHRRLFWKRSQAGLAAFLFGYAEAWGWHTPQSRGIFPNRLWLPNEDFVDDEKLARLMSDSVQGGDERAAFTTTSAGRDLTQAVLSRTDLRRTDFRGSTIRGADFYGAWLQGSRLQVKDANGTIFSRANLRYADFSEAVAEGAYFHRADLQQADLSSATLVGSQFREANLDGANLVLAKLQSASLTDASFRGAVLLGAQMQCAFPERTDFTAADLSGAELQLTSLENSHFEGAKLEGAGLQGATVSLDKFAGADLDRANVWRARVVADNSKSSTSALPPSASASKLETETPPVGFERPSVMPTFNGWVAETLSVLPDYHRRSTSNFLLALDPTLSVPPHFDWALVSSDRRDKRRYRKALGQVLERLACDPAGRPHVARRLLSYTTVRDLDRIRPIDAPPRFGDLHMASLRRIAGKLARAARAKPDDKIDCEGGRGLTEVDLARLEQLIQRVRADDLKPRVEPTPRP